jgi:hypothetical protein
MGEVAISRVAVGGLAIGKMTVRLAIGGINIGERREVTVCRLVVGEVAVGVKVEGVTVS